MFAIYVEMCNFASSKYLSYQEIYSNGKYFPDIEKGKNFRQKA